MMNNTESALNAYQRSLLKLYGKSPLKKAKYAAIEQYLPVTEGLVCLDIGSDNGVLSYLLRKRRGDWYSADLEADVVNSIAKMVDGQVHRLDGGSTDFPDDFFDLVVIIDFLEHIDTDKAFVSELARIMKPGARLIVNVPHDRPKSLIRRLRLVVGLTDEKHGHVRPGYDRTALEAVLSPHFDIQSGHSYSRFFIELFDVGVSLIFGLLRRGRVSKKGVVVTGEDIRAHDKKFKLFSLIYPLVWLMTQLDRLLFFTPGYSLIVQAELNDSV